MSTRHLRKLTAILLPFLTLTLSCPAFGDARTDLITQTLGGPDGPNTEALIQMGNNAEFMQELKSMPPPPVDPNAGRKEKQEGASGMAIFGAVMGFAACAMLMAAAAKAPEDQKMQMMAQALQQCGQAAQSLDTGNKNQDGANLMSSQPAGMPTVGKASTFTPPKKSADTKLPDFGSSEGRGVASTSGEDGITVPDLGAGVDTSGIGNGNGGSGSDPDDFDFDVNSKPKQVSPTVLDQPKLTFDEPKSGVTPTQAAGFYGVGGLPAAKSGGSNVADLVTIAKAEKDRARGQVTDPPAGGSGADGAEASGGSSKFNLASLFGDPAGDDHSGGPGFNDILVLPNQAKDDRKRLNIFEYATFRYKKASKDEGRVRPRFAKVEPGVVPPIIATFDFDWK